MATVLAGVGILSPQEEARAFELWTKFCLGPNQVGPYGTNYGPTQVYCKIATGEQEETYNHQIQIPPSTQVHSQVVFVRPPPVRYNHLVHITGSAGPKSPPAKIYVLPQKNSHQISTSYIPGQAEKPEKPVVYFLKGSQGVIEGSQVSPPPEYGPPSNQVSPPPQYGPPQSQQPYGAESATNSETVQFGYKYEKPAGRSARSEKPAGKVKFEGESE